MATQIKLRRDSYTNWYNANPTLALGEPAYDTTNNKLKIGDGSTTWRGLSYLTDASGATFPADASGILTNDGSGNLSWQPSTGGGSITVGDGVGTSVTDVTEILINGTITDIGGGTVGITVSGGADQNVWIQTLESSDPGVDRPQQASSVEYDSAGNIIALFSHTVADNSSYTAVAKYSSDGAIIWSVRFGPGFNTDGWGLAVDSDNAIYVAGSFGGDTAPYYKSFLTKLSGVDGSEIWNKSYDFGFSSASSVVDVDSSDNPVVVGYADENSGEYTYITTTKIDKVDGSIIWSKKLNGQANEAAYGMAVGSDGSIVAVGYMSQLGLGSTNAAATAVAVPSSNPNWVTQYNSPTGIQFLTTGDITYSLLITDGVPEIKIVSDFTGGRTVGDNIATLLGQYFGGTTGVDDMVINVASVSTAAGDQDDRMVVVKYNSNGDVVWQRAVQFEPGFDCSGADADIDSQGNIYVVGQYSYNLNPGYTSAMSIVKFNSSGVKQWSRRVVGDCSTFGTSIVVGPDDKLYVSGVTATADQSDYFWVVAKYGFDGLVEWQRLIDNTTTWSFAGGGFFGGGGGSNIAVKTGFVALAGTFGDPGPTPPYATLVQLSATGETFSVADWDVKAATFSGTINNTASDITVITTNLTSDENTTNIAVNTETISLSSGSFLIGTLYRSGGTVNQLVNGSASVVLNTDGTITFPTKTVTLGNGNNITGLTLALGTNSGEAIITTKEFTADDRGYWPLRLVGQRGYGTWSTPGYGGYGGGIEIHGGLGGETNDNLATTDGGEGGYVEIKAGNGQAGKKGGYLELRAGDATWSDASNNGSASPNNVFGGNVTLAAGNATNGVAAGKGFGGSINIIAGVGNAANQSGRIQVITDNGNWQFTQTGEFRVNNSFTKTLSSNLQAQSVTQVVWTATEDFISGVKLLIQVETDVIGDTTGWHSQVCEAIIASRGYASGYPGPGGEPQMTVYGVTHTSVDPLVTFTVQRNPTTLKIEVVATRTTAVALTTSVSLRIYSVETGTND